MELELVIRLEQQPIVEYNTAVTTVPVEIQKLRDMSRDTSRRYLIVTIITGTHFSEF
jgi:hypothetical protein